MNKRFKAYLLLLITSIIWGIAGPIIKYTSKFVQPFTFLFWRFLITSLVLSPIFLIYKKIKHIKLNLKTVLLLSIIGFLGTTFCLSLLFIGYNCTTALDGSLIYSIAPILVIVGGALFLKEEVTKQEQLGAIFAFIGSVIAIIQPVLENKSFALKNIYGNILILISAIAWAAYCLLVRRFETKEKIDPFILTSVSFFIGFITIIPFFLLENKFLILGHSTRQVFQFPINALPGILYMSLLSSVVAYFTYNLGYSLIEASEATIFDYLKPIFAAPLAVIWLGEKITIPFLAGASLIFFGIFLTEYKNPHQPRG